MGQRQQLQFRPEFKADAVAPLWSPGRPVAAITDELGIGEPELSYWLKGPGEPGDGGSGLAQADSGRWPLTSACRARNG
jgi:transposase-like protein